MYLSFCLHFRLEGVTLSKPAPFIVVFYQDVCWSAFRVFDRLAVGWKTRAVFVFCFKSRRGSIFVFSDVFGEFDLKSFPDKNHATLVKFLWCDGDCGFIIIMC